MKRMTIFKDWIIYIHKWKCLIAYSYSVYTKLQMKIWLRKIAANSSKKPKHEVINKGEVLAAYILF